ncbi:kinesin family-like protein [Plasmopara halstedii]|uniref:Kinesin family-like protein n=1 Tax=Plasmopara halstedii TaxID=4781 RepID=A0A0P1A5D6_PLAHL|nr:kinesin family-like protein [Plasmopara halstedii]CEG35758.1 kinesin family-like protein [Plasmopara halstedii]|eukprot:XP_024572127.1 kinesin family-like protein [Plasmopara halstedii]
MYDSTRFDWTLAYVIVLAVATATTGATLLLAFKHIKVGSSAVQYITHSVCRLYFIYSLMRLLLYIGVLTEFDDLHLTVDEVTDGELLRTRAVYSSDKDFKLLVVTVTLIGDCALLCTTFFITVLAYEIKRLIIKSMDRGLKRERTMIHRYCLCAYIGVAVFAVFMAISVFLPPNVSKTLQNVAFFFQLTCVWVSVLYPAYATIWISCQKRARSAVDTGLLVLHQRIKTFVIVNCVLVFPCCVVEGVAHFYDDVNMIWLGLAEMLYYISGAGTAFAIGMSTTCCYRTLRPLMPNSVYEQILEKGYFIDELSLNKIDVIVEAPAQRPIFVVTDIEGSSQLWSGNPQAMAEAQSIHDDLLRLQLPRFRGYEIATAGDSFQLAFHCVRDALGWCVSVQEKLLKASWPTALLKYENAVRVYDVWTRMLFSGLRVRMAVHNGDERLVCSRHPTTGRMTYLGLSEMMAREMSEMGQGGQIVMSDSARTIYMNELLETASSSTSDGTFEEKFKIQPFPIKFEYYPAHVMRRRDSDVLSLVRPPRSARLSYSYSQCSSRSRSNSIDSDMQWSERASSIAPSEVDGSEVLDVDDLHLLQQQTSTDGQESVRVTVRFRPLLPKEKTDRSAWTVHTETATVEVAPILGQNARHRGVYTFDEVYDGQHSTRTIYDGLASSIARSALDGIHGSIFAYGQTSSGKTHTMQGSRFRSRKMTLTDEKGADTERRKQVEDSDGLIQLAVKDLFDEMARRSDVEYLVRTSYLEVYNETVKDLLSSGGDTINRRRTSTVHVREHPVTGVFTDNSERVVTDACGVIQALRDGEKQRAVGITRMNERSSRSHTIFRLVIESKTRIESSTPTEDDADVERVRVGCLNFVDLAGSESARAVSSGGKRLTAESANINKSLLALSRVVVALGNSKSNQQDHINFRDSKLTRILQPSLCGAARVLFVCCASPAPAYIEDTRSTLKFASRAKRIKVNAVVNEVLDQRSRALMQLARENQLLRQRLEALASASRDEMDAMEEHAARLRMRVISLEAAAAAPRWTSFAVKTPVFDDLPKDREDSQPELTGLEEVNSLMDLNDQVLEIDPVDEEDTDVDSQGDSSRDSSLMVADVLCPTCVMRDDALELAKVRGLEASVRIEQLEEQVAQLLRKYEQKLGDSDDIEVEDLSMGVKIQCQCVLDVEDDGIDETKALSGENNDTSSIPHTNSFSLTTTGLLSVVVDTLKKRSFTEVLAAFVFMGFIFASVAWNIATATQ